MNLRLIVATWCVWLIGSCTNNPQQGIENTSTQTPAFVFSNKTAETGLHAENNWCNRPFEEGVVINAETTNLNRRYFAVGDGLYKVVVRRGNTAAPFMVKRRGAALEIFTSDQYPTCLARRSDFSLIGDGRTMLYFNPPYYEFRVETEPWQNALKVTLEFPPGSENGLMIHRQKNMD